MLMWCVMIKQEIAYTVQLLLLIKTESPSAYSGSLKPVSEC